MSVLPVKCSCVGLCEYRFAPSSRFCVRCGTGSVSLWAFAGLLRSCAWANFLGRPWRYRESGRPCASGFASQHRTSRVLLGQVCFALDRRLVKCPSSLRHQHDRRIVVASEESIKHFSWTFWEDGHRFPAGAIVESSQRDHVNHYRFLDPTLEYWSSCVRTVESFVRRLRARDLHRDAPSAQVARPRWSRPEQRPACRRPLSRCRNPLRANDRYLVSSSPQRCHPQWSRGNSQRWCLPRRFYCSDHRPSLTVTHIRGCTWRHYCCWVHCSCRYRCDTALMLHLTCHMEQRWPGCNCGVLLRSLAQLGILNQPWTRNSLSNQLHRFQHTCRSWSLSVSLQNLALTRQFRATSCPSSHGRPSSTLPQLVSFWLFPSVWPRPAATGTSTPRVGFFPNSLLDAIGVAALESVQTRTCALMPMSMNIDCIFRAPAALTMTESYSAARASLAFSTIASPLSQRECPLRHRS